MIKLLKFEVKRSITYPLAVVILGTLINFVLMILCAASNPNKMPLSKYLSVSNTFSQWTIIISGLILLLILTANSLKAYSIYDLSKINEKKLIAARLLLLFAFITLSSLLMIAETTVVGKILLRRQPVLTIDVLHSIYHNSMCLTNCGFISWLQPLAIGVFFTWVFALVLSTAPLIRFTNNKFAKFMIVASVIALGVVIQAYVGGLFANACDALNFNETHTVTFTENGSSDKYFFDYSDVSYGIINAFQLQLSNANYVSFNILNLGLDLFIFSQIACCLIAYGMRRMPISKRSAKKNVRQLLQLIFPACLIVFYVSFAPAVAIDTPYLNKLSPTEKLVFYQDDISNEQMPIYYVAKNDDGRISVLPYVNIIAAEQFPSRYQVSVSVTGLSFDKYPDNKKYSLGNGIELSEDKSTLTVQNSGAYLYSVSIYNTITHRNRGVAIYIFYDAPQITT